MFDKQSDFTGALALQLAPTCGSEVVVELLITRWLLDNNVRFRNAGVTVSDVISAERQGEK